MALTSGRLDCLTARFSEADIAAGATIAFIEPAEYRDVEIAGALRAKLRATGIVTIRISGCFEGQLQGQHLAVEDGGGLRAALQIESAKR